MDLLLLREQLKPKSGALVKRQPSRESRSAAKSLTSSSLRRSSNCSALASLATPFYAGLMFWLTRNRFSGSYFRFTCARRAWLSRYAAFTLSSPSSIIMLT